MTFISAITIAPVENELTAADCGYSRRNVVSAACAGTDPTEQKRLVAALYESGHLTDGDVVDLINRLGLKEA